MKLTEQTCGPVKSGDPPLVRKEAEDLMRQIPTWSFAEKEIGKEFRFKDFCEAMEFVNRVAAIANEQDHHPDIFIYYNKVKLALSTHKIGGLSLNDFIVAAKIDLLAEPQRSEKAA